MAEYILNVMTETSKLDWAMPFQRTGAFPLDRSAVFGSLADATAYARGDGSDERKLGGTSYVGQIISVYDDEEVAAYVITAARGLMKLAATTASGDLAADVADLQGKLETLTTDVKANKDLLGKLNPQVTANKEAIETLQTKVAGVYTKSETDAKIGEAVAAAPHMVRKVVDDLAAIEAEKDSDAALNTIYMVPSGLKEDDNKYYEYIVIEVGEERKVERVGSWEVDLSVYAKTADVDKKLADKANQSTVDVLSKAVDGKADATNSLAGYGIKDAYTKLETDNKIKEAVKSATGGESAASVLAELNAYKTENDGKVGQNTADIAALKEVGGEKNVINGVSEEFNIDENRQLSVVSLPMSKVTDLTESLNAKATVEKVTEVETKVTNLGTQVTDLAELLNKKAAQADLDALGDRVTDIENTLIWKDMEENE